MLEDLPLADVLQFIHLGRRTGTLYLWQGEDRRAEIGFHDGRIISAWMPNQRKLGDLLVSGNHITQETLESALYFQRTDGSGKSLGQILIERSALEKSRVYPVIREQIQKTIFDLVSWRHGYFQFEVDELHPSDDFGMTPEELLDNLDLNTQGLVLEATRLFDERRREQQEKEEEATGPLEEKLKLAGFGAPTTTAPPPVEPAGNASANGRGQTAPMQLGAVRCQVVSDDPLVLQSLVNELNGQQAKVVAVPLREAGTRLPGEMASPIVILDLRCPDVSSDDIASLARTRPGAPVVALVEQPEEETAVYSAGALAAVVPGRASIVECCRNLIRVLTQPQPHGAGVIGLNSGFSRFRQVVFDVQSGLASATMALNLMHVISDSVERAILFLVEKSGLVAVGAFGFSNDGDSLAEVTRGLRIQPEEGSVLHRVVAQAQPEMVKYDEANLPLELAGLVGRPASGQVVLFPVLGAENTISIIYTDNGALEDEIRDINLLELATSQVGMAFENELLRHEMAGHDFSDDVEHSWQG